MSTLKAREGCNSTPSITPLDMKVACLQFLTRKWEPPRGIVVHEKSEQKNADFDVTSSTSDQVGVCLVRRGDERRRRYLEGNGMIVILFDVNRTPERCSEILVFLLRHREKRTRRIQNRFNNRGKKQLQRQARRIGREIARSRRTR